VADLMAETTLTCPNCGAPVEAHMTQCRQCGARLMFTATEGAGAPAVRAETTPPAPVSNPYDKGYDLSQLSDEQREGFKHHTLKHYPTWLVIVFSILTIGIFGIIYHGLKHSRLPKVKSDDFGAGKGIGFLFIPFFNLYWQFVFWLRLVDRINFQYRLRGAPEPISRDLALATIIVSLTAIVIGITGIVSSIMALIVAGQIQSATNRLVKGEVQPVVIPPPIDSGRTNE
jgi:hypothetical protein